MTRACTHIALALHDHKGTGVSCAAPALARPRLGHLPRCRSGQGHRQRPPPTPRERRARRPDQRASFGPPRTGHAGHPSLTLLQRRPVGLAPHSASTWTWWRRCSSSCCPTPRRCTSSRTCSTQPLPSACTGPHALLAANARPPRLRFAHSHALAQGLSAHISRSAHSRTTPWGLWLKGWT
jgi:hypothetical protein